MSQKWEYSVQEIKTADVGGITQCVNNLAADGWELILVNPPLYYFKRAKESETPEVDEVQERLNPREV